MNQQPDVNEGVHSIASNGPYTEPTQSDTIREKDRTNQSEDDGAAYESDAPAVTTPTAKPGFFRPWKKAQLQDAAEDNNCEEETANKWKVRALMNPFAKRKPNVSSGTTAGALASMRLAPSEPEQNAREEPEQPAPLVPSKARPTTPLPAPATITPHAPPMTLQPVSHRSLRSRGATPPTEMSGSSSAESLPQSELDRTGGTAFPIQARRVASLVQRSPPAVRTGSRLLEPLQTGPAVFEPIEYQPREPPQQSKEQEPMDASDFFDRESHPSYAAPVRPKPQLTKYAPATKARPKLSTLDALNEIKRKREARRTQHSEEKQRIKAELKEHGDDAGYKFRRLITKYREGLAPEQQPVKPDALPPLLRSNGGAYRHSTDAPKLSVFVRKRPLSKKELKAKGYDIISCLFASEDLVGRDRRVRRELLCHEPKLKVDGSESLENHSFHFDGVFDEWQDNSSIYDATVGPLVPFLVGQQAAGLEAPTVTVFAYGQTGSGKTFTMKSIYRQAATDLFDQLASSPVDVGVSFYEIYMNHVNDLLNSRKRVQLMEDGDGVVQLPGLQQIGITTAEELLDLVKRGEDSRATSANAVHDDSSRSHALLRVTLYAQDSRRVVARLAMVDLAGSERASDTQADR